MLVLASGLRGSVLCHRRYQIEHFSKRFRILSWDYRGLFESRLPAACSPVDVARPRPPTCEVLLERMGAERAVVVGWSMGVQVALEHHASFPGRASHLVLINGTAGRPFRFPAPTLDVSFLMPPLLRRVQRPGSTGTALLKQSRRGSSRGSTYSRR